MILDILALIAITATSGIAALYLVAFDQTF